MFNINVYLDCNGMIFKEGLKDALGLIVGDYPESSSLPKLDSNMLSRQSRAQLGTGIQDQRSNPAPHLLNSFHNIDAGNR